MIDFFRYRFATLFFSVLVFAGAIGAYIHKRQTRGQAFKYSIDFTGGTQVLLGFQNEVSVTNLKDALEKGGWGNATVREFSKKEFLIRVQEFSKEAQGLGVRIKEVLQKNMPGNTITIREVEGVGPGVGGVLRYNSLMGLLIALALMLLYIGWRFGSFAFATGAVVALFHDAFIMLAVFLIFDREISVNLVAAIVMVLGYSINDTIVIFSRIRDNLKTMKGVPLKNIVNMSLNQTLRRTILTSISTALVVLSIFIFGGEALNDFAFALLIGIIFGTYSSIYIASPVMMLLHGEQ